MNSCFSLGLNKFAKEHAAQFCEIGPDEEQPLEWYTLYQQYEALIQERLETFVTCEQTTAEEVFKQCALASGKEGFQFVDYLIASSEYQNFVGLMLGLTLTLLRTPIPLTATLTLTLTLKQLYP